MVAAAWADSPFPSIEGPKSDDPHRYGSARSRGPADRGRRRTAECDPVRDLLGEADVVSAYAVQRLLTEDSLRRGRRTPGE
jgi:hypothetical protein